MEALTIVLPPETALTVNRPLVSPSLILRDASTVAMPASSLSRSITSPPAGAVCEISRVTSWASPASIMMDAGMVTSGTVVTDSDSVSGSLIFPEISTALASRSMVSPATRDPGTLMVKLACASPEGGTMDSASEYVNAPDPLISMLARPTSSAASTMIVTVSPGTMVDDPDSLVMLTMVGGTESTTGSMTLGAWALLPAWSTAVACMTSVSDGVADGETVKTKVDATESWAGEISRVSVKVDAPLT